MTRRRRHALAACGLTLALAVAAVAGLTLSGNSGTTAARSSGEMPTALGAHLAELSKAIPGTGGESAEGPGSAEEQEFAALAYPDTDVSLAKLQAMRAAGAALKGKFPKGKGSNGSWVSVGPSNALYPATQFRNSLSYVPAEYSAGGRTTSLAIAPTCKPGNCRLWLGVAGGGVWRTKNALAGNPSWEFLSGSFGIQAIGSVVVDPNDPSGNTIYAGTGEANASGDSAAGVGLYKSTNGGDTWTGPIGVNVFNARAIGAIAVKPGSPGTLYVGTTRAVRGVASVSSSGVSVIPGAPKWGLYKSTDGGASWTFVHNGAPTIAPCTGDAAESLNGTPCSPRGVRHVELDPSNPDIVYASSYARGVWRSPDGGATWTQINPSLQPRQHDDPRSHRGHEARERQDADVRLRGRAGRPDEPALPLGRRRRGRARVHEPLERERRQPRLRNAQPVHGPVLVRRVRLHARRATPMSCTPVARIPTARSSPTSGRWSSRPTPASPAPT